jgi:hypothetical protein
MASKFKQFLALSGYPDVSRWVSVLREFVGPYECLSFGNGASWARTDMHSRYKYVLVNSSGSINYSWNPSYEERTEVEASIVGHPDIKGKGVTTVLMRIYGLQENTESKQRPIRNDIRKHFSALPCCVCGCTTNVEADHKNDMYNDPRVLRSGTQTLDDFQPLCRHCNLQKRYAKKVRTRESVRYPATRIPMLAVFGVDYVTGESHFDPNDIHALVGTFWYDPVEFMKQIHLNK